MEVGLDDIIEIRVDIEGTWNLALVLQL